MRLSTLLVACLPMAAFASDVTSTITRTVVMVQTVTAKSGSSTITSLSSSTTTSVYTTKASSSVSQVTKNAAATPVSNAGAIGLAAVLGALALVA